MIAGSIAHGSKRTGLRTFIEAIQAGRLEAVEALCRATRHSSKPLDVGSRLNVLPHTYGHSTRERRPWKPPPSTTPLDSAP